MEDTTQTNGRGTTYARKAEWSPEPVRAEVTRPKAECPRCPERMKMVRELQTKIASPNGLAKQKQGTGKRLTPMERAKLKKEREKTLRRMKREQRRRS